MDSWYDHFSTLFSNADENDQVFEVMSENANFDDIEYMIFTSDITDDEILHGIRELKLNKASSGNIIAQQLGFGANAILPYIRKLFNRLFKG